ncbi:MAG: AraC family transcriptional regulator [Pseudomonadota bacterium]
MSADLWLALIGVTVALSVGAVYGRLHGADLPGALVAFATSSMFLLLPAFLLLYVRSITGRINLLDALWLAPALLHFALMSTASANDGGFQFVNGFAAMPTGSALASVPIWLPVVFGLVCPLAALWEAKRHQQKVKAAMSTLQGVDLHWVGFLQIVAIIGASLGILSLQITGGSPDIAPLLVLIIIAFQVAAVSIIIVGQRPVPQFISIVEENLGTGSDPDVVNAFSKMESAMIRDKPHLADGLTIEDFAATVGLSRQTVSTALKAHDQSFYEYINSWRVAEAKELLADDTLKDVSILSLAYDSGFSSKATFNRVFKATAGCTPREFRNEARAKAIKENIKRSE